MDDFLVRSSSTCGTTRGGRSITIQRTTSPLVTRVLLVDDHADTLMMTGRLLRGRGFDVTCAATAEEAIVASDGVRLDAVVSDLALPGMDGIELMKRLIADGQRFVGIVLSGYGPDIDDGHSGDGFTPSQWITKPVDIDRLAAALTAARPGTRAP